MDGWMKLFFSPYWLHSVGLWNIEWWSLWRETLISPEWCIFRRSVCGTAHAFCSSCVCLRPRLHVCHHCRWQTEDFGVKALQTATQWDLHKCHNQLMHRCIGGYQGQLAAQARWRVFVYRDWCVGKNLTRACRKNNLDFLQVQKLKEKKYSQDFPKAGCERHLNWIRPKCFRVSDVLLSLAVL